MTLYLYLFTLPFVGLFIFFYTFYNQVLINKNPDHRLSKFFSESNVFSMLLFTLVWPVMLVFVFFNEYVGPWISGIFREQYGKFEEQLNKIAKYNHLCDTCCHCGYSVRHFTSQGRKVVKTGLGMELCEDCVDKLYYSTFPHRKPKSRKKST